MKNKSSNKQKSVLIDKFPVKQQRYSYDCGISSLWCILHYLGYNISYWDVYKLLGPNQKEGVEGESIEKVLRKLKVKFIAEKSNIRKLRTYCDNNCPSIVSIQHRKEYNKEWRQTRRYGHYVVVLKIINNKIILMDPNYGKIKSLRIKDFKERWHDADEKVFYRNCAITCLYEN